MRRGVDIDAAAGAPDTSFDPVTLVYIDAQAFNVRFVDAILCALRTQVPVRHLAGQTVFRSGRTVANLEAAKHQEAELLAKAQKAYRLAARAVDLVVRAETIEEEDAYRARAAAHRAEHARLTAAAAALMAAREPTSPQGPFEAYTDVLLPALTRLVTGDNRVSQAQYQALATIVRDMRMEFRQTGWWATAMVRINTISAAGVDGVSELGPIEWKAGGKPTRERWSAPAEHARPDNKGALRMMLEATGRLSERAVRLAVGSRHPELPYVLLNQLANHPYPSFVGDDWKQDAFTRHLVSVYQGPDERMGASHRRKFSPQIQAVLYYAEQHEQFTLQQAVEDLYLPPVPTTAEALGLTTYVSTSRRPMPRLLDAVGPVTSGKSALLRGIRCSCGQVASVLARAPEVPGDLLCMCGLLPQSDKHHAGTQVRFPSVYLQRAPFADCLAALRESWENYLPTEWGMQVLQRLVEAPDGRLRKSELVKVCSPNRSEQAISNILDVLRRYGLVHQVVTAAGNIKMWEATPRGVDSAASGATSANQRGRVLTQ